MSTRKLRNSKSRLSFDADDIFSALGALSDMATQLVSNGSFSAAQPSPPTILPELSSSRNRGAKSSAYAKEVDFTEEAHKVFLTSKLHLSNDKKQDNIHLDAIFKASNDKSIIYCGDYHAASDLLLLKKYNITYVVNCTRPCFTGELPNYHEGVAGYKYYNFPIAIWQACVATPGNKKGKYGESLPEVSIWFGGLVSFIDEAIANGACVLIHCLAGAHRAGSTSIAMLMNYANLDYEQALIAAKICRPVIDPIGNLPILLGMYDRQRIRPKEAIERNVRMVGNIAIRNMTPMNNNTFHSISNTRASFSRAEELQSLHPSPTRINDMRSGINSVSTMHSTSSLSLTPLSTAKNGESVLSIRTLAVSPLDLSTGTKLPGTIAGYRVKKTRRRSTFN